MRYYLKKLLIITFICLSVKITAQQKDTTQHRTLIFSNSYSNFVGFYGRQLGTNQWQLNSKLAYTTKNNWSFAATNSYWSEVPEISAVFDFDVAKKFKLSKSSELEFGYEYEFVSKNNLFMEAGILNNDLTANYSFDSKYFLANLDAGYLFGGGSKAYYTSLQLQGNLEKNDFLGADYVSFQPGIEIIGGTYDIFNKTTTKKITKKKIIDKATTNFDLLDYDIVMPLTYQKGKFTFTLEYHYNIPVTYDATEIVNRFSYVKLGIDFNFL